MEFKIIDAQDRKIIDRLVEIEKEVFGENGGADYWLIMAFVRYGFLGIIMEGNEIISVAQYMQVFGKKELFLYGFLTREKFRKKGFGKKLLEICEERLRNMEIESIILTVDPENRAGIGLYKSMGYINLGLEKDEYGAGVDRYIMKKQLI